VLKFWQYKLGKNKNIKGITKGKPKKKISQLADDTPTILEEIKCLGNSYNIRSVCNQCKEIERKLQIIGIFLTQRAITLSKMARLYPKQNLTYRYSHDKSVFYTKFHFSMCNQCEENERKQQIIGIVLSPRAITLSTSILSVLQAIQSPLPAT
jgi:recombinational DNA repair protein RecR